MHNFRNQFYSNDWYNGFSPEQTTAVTPIQNKAVKEGKLQQPLVCSICGHTRPDDPKGAGYIYMHLEDYERPLDIYPACKRCHAALHARFRDPERWQRIVRAHFRHGAWFTLLSMDSASQQRSFWLTYPDGLPPPD
jgi:hypothetical protein